MTVGMIVMMRVMVNDGGDCGDGIELVGTHCSFPLIIDTSTPSTLTVAFSDDNREFIRLMRSVAVNEPSSEE